MLWAPWAGLLDSCLCELQVLDAQRVLNLEAGTQIGGRLLDETRCSSGERLAQQEPPVSALLHREGVSLS